METVIPADANATVVSNVIVVGVCPMDKVLNRSLGVLARMHQFVCRKCKTIYTQPVAD